MEIIQASLFDGKVCTGCGEWRFLDEYSHRTKSKDGRDYKCKTCKRLYRANNSQHAIQVTRAWEKRNPDRAKNIHSICIQRMKEQNPDHFKNYSKQYRENHPERVAEWKANSAPINKEKRTASHRRYYQKNKERVRLRIRQYAKRHPEYNATSSLRYLARKRGAVGHYTTAEWRALCAQYNHLCLCCGEQKKLTADHIVPLSRGGSNSIDNIQPLCQPCNSSKGVQTIDYRQPG
jgi:5-methylcytosine-specific restriction endonuclease McrA